MRLHSAVTPSSGWLSDEEKAEVDAMVLALPPISDEAQDRLAITLGQIDLRLAREAAARAAASGQPGVP